MTEKRTDLKTCPEGRSGHDRGSQRDEGSHPEAGAEVKY